MDSESIDKKTIEVAKLLRRLFRKRFLLESASPSAFRSLIDHKSKIQEKLEPFLARLHLDESLGVAFLDVQSEEIEEILSYSLFDYKRLSMLSSLLLFFLRNEYMEYYKNPDQNVEPRCELNHLKEFLLTFNSFDSNQKFEKNLKKSLKELVELKVLQSLGEEGGPFVITPVCNYLLPTSQLEEFSKDLEIFLSGEQKAEDLEGL